jgi:hypothetical protein
VVHRALDTALQNGRICASQRTKPGGGDRRQNGGSARDYLPGIAWFGALAMFRRASGCPHVYSSALSV